MRRLVFVVVMVFTLLSGASRAAAATIAVTSTDDSGAGTLRQAITDANATAAADTITFDVSALGGLISLESPLPAVTQPATIDGKSDPGYFGDPVVHLGGSGAGVLANGLTIVAGPTTVQGLAIEFFANDGISIAADSTTLTANAISSNGAAGVSIDANGNTLTANSIGGFSGGNTGPGVLLAAGASGSTIGGSADGAGNQIQANAAGVVLAAGAGTGNRILRNAIGGNAGAGDGLGIDLDGDGVTANDDPDIATGANTRLNFPVLSSLATDATSTTVTGALDARPGTLYRVELFGVGQCDPSGNGEGDTYIGTVSVTTAASGHAVINAVLPSPLVDRFVTATATDPAGNTSEFSPCQAGPPSGVVISNGTVQLGVNKTASLNYNCVTGEPGCPGPSTEGTGPVGLRYVPLNLDSTAPGCPCEGWGVGDVASGLSGFANESIGTANVVPVSLTRSPDGKQATVVVDVVNPAIADRSLRVTHVYRPSPLSGALYEDVVSVKNTGTQPLADLLFRRVMDWDIEPTPFREWVTNHGTSPQLRFDSDQGFASADPLTGPAYLESESAPGCGPAYTGHCEFADLGAGGTYPTVTTPSDHGGLFDFGFGALPAGATKVITTYYGAAPNETQAVAALNAGGAQVYSLGESDCPNSGSTTGGCNGLPAGAGPTQGAPATFMFGFVTTSGDLSITQSDSPDPAAPGQEVTYTLTVHNNGPDAAAAARVEDTLPSGAGVTIGAISTSQGSCAPPAGGKVVCSLGSMPSGSTQTVTVHATRATAGSLTNSATVSSPSEDANPGNNATSETTTVLPTATLSVNDVTVSEGDSGSVNASFTITRGGDTTATSSVHFATSAGTATAGTDFTGKGDTLLTFDPGQTTKTVDVAVLGDTLDENDETFTLQLSSPTGATVVDGSGLGTITDDDTPPALSVNDVSVTEGSSGTTTATFVVTLSQASGRTVGVTAATADGTATQPADYTANSSALSFAPGQTTKTVTVAIKGDALDEDDETFLVNLSSPSNASVADGQGVGTIVDDDGPPSASISDQTLAEGDSGTAPMTFTVSLGAPSGKPVSVGYATADGSARSPSDFGTASGTLSFSPGQTSKTFAVGVVGDTVVEPDETFTATLSAPANVGLGDAGATGTIVNDDSVTAPPVVPVINVGNSTVSPEGNSGSKPAMFDVTLSRATTVPVTVSFATADGSATQPADYAAASGSLTFAPGETAKAVSVAVKGDLLEEANETFALVLSNPAAATLGASRGTGTIVDDDQGEPGSEVPGPVHASDLFCGRQHRGKCRGMKFKAQFEGPGNAVWTFAAYNPTPGKRKATATPVPKQLRLGKLSKQITQAGTISARFKLRGAKADRLRKKFVRAGYRDLRVSLAFTTQSGKRFVVKRHARLKR